MSLLGDLQPKAWRGEQEGSEQILKWWSSTAMQRHDKPMIELFESDSKQGKAMSALQIAHGDSCATLPTVMDGSEFSMNKKSSQFSILMPIGEAVKAKRKEKSEAKLSRTTAPVKLDRLLHVPKMANNLISIFGQLDHG